MRFSILHDIEIREIAEVPDLGQFLTTEMRERFSENNQQIAEETFRRTFAALSAAASDNALRKYDASRARFGGPFLISAFELVALGVAANIGFVEGHDAPWLENKIKAIWSDPAATGIYGQGVSTARRLPKTLALGREFFSRDRHGL